MIGAARTATGPSQRRLAVAAGATLFGLLGAHTLLEVGRDSLFLTRLPVEQLPFAYLLIAAAAALGAGLDRRLPERWARHLPRLTLLAGALMAGSFFVLFGTGWAWAPHAFYVGTGVIATLAVAQFWRLLTELFTVAEAKRMYTRVAAVGSLGAMAGAASAELALRWIDARGLLLLGGAVYVITAVVPHAWLSNAVPRRAMTSTSADASGGMSVRTESYLRQLLVLLALAATTATLIDYVFKATIDAAVGDEDLPRFLSRFHLGLNFLSVIVQLAIAPKIFRTRGVTRGLVTLPLLVLFGAAFVFTSGGLVAAIFLRGADGSLRNSLYRSAIELLYFPLARNVRNRFKALVDAVGHRTGQTIGSIGILLATYTGLGPKELAIAVGALALGSLALSVSMRGGYVALFREHLRAGSLRPTVPELDLHSLEHLMASLNSDDDDEVLASLKLLEEYESVHLVPTTLLFHPSPRVVLRVLEMFEGSGRKELAELGRRLLDHPDADVQDAAARALASVLTSAELRAALAQHHDAAVNIAVLVTMVTRKLDPDGSAEREIREMVEGGSRPALLAVVRAIRSQRSYELGDVLHGLVERAERDVELRRELAHAFEALRDTSAIPVLIGWLGPRQARAEARAALVAIGDPARGPLETALKDTRRPRALRAHLPRTLAHFRDLRAARALLERLEHEPDGWVRYKILRALRTLRDALPDLRLPKERLREQAREALERAAAMLAERIAVRELSEEKPSLRTPGGELLELVLREKEDEAVDRAVRLLSLTDGRAGATIRRALYGADARLRAESRELLAHLAEPLSSSDALLAFLDETDDEERLSRAVAALGIRTPRPTEYAALVLQLMSDPSDAVRGIAIHHAAELGLLPAEEALARASALLAEEAHV